MNAESRVDESDSAASRSSSVKQVPPEWQFSLRRLLIATTVVSLCLAVGTYLAGVAFIIFAVVLIEVATLLSVDWLIRPANRPLLAFVTAGSCTRGVSSPLLAPIAISPECLQAPPLRFGATASVAPMNPSFEHDLLDLDNRWLVAEKADHPVEGVAAGFDPEAADIV